MYYAQAGVVATTDAVEACKEVNIAVMVGGFPRKEGMERKDVMSKNVSIYKKQASALEQHAAPDCKVRSLQLSGICGSYLAVILVILLNLIDTICQHYL